MKPAGPTGSYVGLVTMALVLGPTHPAIAADEATFADTVLQGGVVYTVDSRNSIQEAIAIQGGRIVYVGTDQGVRAYIGKQTTVIELHGKTVMPGLVDAHNHPIAGGSQL